MNDDDDEITILPHSVTEPKELMIIDNCYELGLMQLNTFLNANNRMLDLI